MASSSSGTATMRGTVLGKRVELRPSSITLSGTVVRQHRTSFPAPLLAVLLDGSSSSLSSGDSVGPSKPSPLAVDASTGTFATTLPTTSLAAGGRPPHAKNLLEVHFTESWVGRCEGLSDGDHVSLSNVHVASTSGRNAAGFIFAANGDVVPAALQERAQMDGLNDDAPLVSIAADPADALPSSSGTQDLRTSGSKGDAGLHAPVSPFIVIANSTTVLNVEQRVHITVEARRDEGDNGVSVLGARTQQTQHIFNGGTAAGPTSPTTAGSSPGGAGHKAADTLRRRGSDTGVVTLGRRASRALVAASLADRASSPAGSPSSRSRNSKAAPPSTTVVNPERSVVNLYVSLHRYYDVLYAQKGPFAAHAAFIERVLGTRRTTVLDVGCGTGALAFHLALGGTPVFALDPSPAMARLHAEKHATFGTHGAAAGLVRFVQASTDTPDFALHSIADNGHEVRRRFGAVLMLDVLSQLPSMAAVRRALAAVTVHAAPGAVLVLSFQSLDWWGRRVGQVAQEPAHYSTDRDSLAVTAASVPPGVLDTVSRVFVKEPSAEGEEDGAEIVTEITALALHPRSEQQALMLTERVVERAISPVFFEMIVEGLGWSVKGVYSSVTGVPFNSDGDPSAVVPKRVYVLQLDGSE